MNILNIYKDESNKVEAICNSFDYIMSFYSEELGTKVMAELVRVEAEESLYYDKLRGDKPCTLYND